VYMKPDDDSLDATLDRYMGRASTPPAGQVESSVDEVWERLRPEADYAAIPAREIVARRSYFPVVAAAFVATVAIGIYSILPVRHVDQPSEPQANVMN